MARITRPPYARQPQAIKAGKTYRLSVDRKPGCPFHHVTVYANPGMTRKGAPWLTDDQVQKRVGTLLLATTGFPTDDQLLAVLDCFV